jgi:PAS domain-containing protein
MFVKIDFRQLGLNIRTIPPPMLGYWGRDLVCRFANAAYAECLGYQAHEMPGRVNLLDILGGHLRDHPYIQQVLSGKMQLFVFENPLSPLQDKHIIASYSPVFANGVVEGFYIYVTCLTDNARYFIF